MPGTCALPRMLQYSGQGHQYTSAQYRNRLNELEMVASLSRKGHSHANAVAESFFSSLKNDLIYDRDYQTRDQARAEIFE